MHIFNSKVLVSGSYSKTNQSASEGMLQVSLRSGESYVYANVPQTVWDRMKKAKSSGRFFTRYIRGQYPTAKFMTKKA